MEDRDEQRYWTSRTDFYDLTYSTQEVAGLLDITPRDVKRLKQRGLLKSSMRGRRHVFTARHVEAFLKRARRSP